jgi:3-oxoacyl-(acyl-carrier-protein) synthase
LNALILKAGRSRPQLIQALSQKPEFRRATRNMMLACSAIRETIDGLSLEKIRLSTILGSSLGELEQTAEFLRSLAVNGVARPTPFQNSLHNATLGFLAHHFSFTGPGFSVSQRYFTGEASLDLASTLLEADLADTVLVSAVDSLVPALEEARRSTYLAPVTLQEGCGTVLLGRPEAALRLGIQPLARLERIELSSTGGRFEGGLFYDSNGIEHLINAIQAGGAPSPLILTKPDGSYSTIRWNSENA